jgi:hypothetical protein
MPYMFTMSHLGLDPFTLKFACLPVGRNFEI